MTDRELVLLLYGALQAVSGILPLSMKSGVEEVLQMTYEAAFMPTITVKEKE